MRLHGETKTLTKTVYIYCVRLCKSETELKLDGFEISSDEYAIITRVMILNFRIT